VIKYDDDDDDDGGGGDGGGFVGTFGQHPYTHIGALVGETVTLSCYIYGDHGSIQWLHNSDIIVQYGQLLDNDTERLNYTCDYSPRWSCKLTILEVQAEDNGEYWCYNSYSEYYFRMTIIRKLCVIL